MSVRYRTLLAAVAAAALAAGCSAVGVGRAQPTWVDKPDLPPADAQPNLPGPGGGGAPGPGAPQQPGPGGGAPGSADDPSVVATKLTLPWGIAVLPDGAAIVGERTTGRILRVEPEPHRPVRPLMTVRGIDATGDGGLLGLALSPTYREDRLVFAYVTTATDNRVLRFELGGTPKPILTGIPKGRTGNGGRLAFGPDGLLYVGTGDAGRPDAAADRASLAGKVLRVTPFGTPADGNPFGSSPVYATGFHDVTGLCFDSRKQLYATDVGNGRDDEVNLVQPGRNYGWPTVTGRPGTADLADAALTLKAAETNPGGCGVVGFGLFVTALSGAQLWAVPLDGAGHPAGTPRALLHGTYGRLRSVEPAPDGALWLTTSNKDGRGRPTPDDDRVIRIVPPPNTTNSPV
jgi:glucose/arabinose dehydrogenase